MAEFGLIRDATMADLDAINAVVARAIHTWKLPDPGQAPRPASVPVHAGGSRSPAAARAGAGLRHRCRRRWEPANPRDLPGAGSGMLLHGLYVDPARHGQGLGARLLGDAAGAARDRGHEGILVRAQADAEGFFARRGFRRLPVLDEARDYAARLWLPLS
jgi:GNAT superfamily N-acetyltransferase